MKYGLKIMLIAAITFPVFLFAQTISKGVDIVSNKKDSGNIYAIIIGVSEYSKLPKLQYADKDALVFYNYLKKVVPVNDSSNLFLFTNSTATRDGIFSSIEDISYKIKEGDKIIFYFSGHGDMEQLIQTNNSLLLLSNCETTGYRRKSNYFLDIVSLKEYFDTWLTKKANLMFVCDACHSGSLVGGEAGRKNNILGLEQAWSQEVKLLSCQPDEVSIEGNQWGGGRGLFSYYFLLGLQGLADNDKNQVVTLMELKNYLETNVSKASSQSQIPFVQGNLKFPLSRVNPDILAKAKKEKLNELGDYAIAFRGATGGLVDLIKDSASKAIYKRFEEKIQSKNFISPEQSCALYYYKLFKNINTNTLVQNAIKVELISALQKPFDILLDYIYNNEYQKMGILEKIEIEHMLDTALSLVANNNVLANQVRSKILFLQACELAVDILPGSRRNENMEKLEQGIDLLKQAVLIDKFSPHLYLKLGDYYLYTNKFNNSVDNYTHYQQLLPNDANSFNKLGLAYMAIKKYDLAADAFTKCLKLKPGFSNAEENLRIVKARK